MCSGGERDVLTALCVFLLVLAGAVSPDFVRYVRAQRAAARRMDEWLADIRREQDEAFAHWQSRGEETRKLTSRRVA